MLADVETSAVAQLLGEGFLRDAQGDAAVIGYEVGRQIDGSVEYQRRRLGVAILQAVNELPGYIRDVTDIALQTGVAVDQTDECLRVVALLDVVHSFDGLGIGGIAADAPHRICGIEYHPTPAQYLYCILDIFFACHAFLIFSAKV